MKEPAVLQDIFFDKGVFDDAKYSTIQIKPFVLFEYGIRNN